MTKKLNLCPEPFHRILLITILLFLSVYVRATPGFEIKEINLPTGVKLEYIEKGNSREIPVVFLHGYTDSWHSFEQVVKLMPAGFHCIAISQRGHGNSSKPERGYNPEDFAKDVAAFIKAKKLGSCILVGHSMGGLITQQFALDFPGLTRAVIIVSSDPFFADNPGIPEFAEEVKKLKDPIDYGFVEAFQKSTAVKPIDSALFRLWISESVKVPVYVWKQVLNEIIQTNFESRLSLIKAPALILYGSLDSFCPKQDQDKFIEKMKSAKLVEYDGTGHALHWEEPQRFVDDIVEFINANKHTK